MKINIATVSKPNFNYAVSGFELYSKRLSYYHDLKIHHFKNSVSDNEILNFFEDTYLIILDVKGRQFSTIELANYLNELSIKNKRIGFLIGGAEGLSENVQNSADFKWSLSNLTFPHDLAMIVTLEALYRATTVNFGLPYHK